MRAWLAPFNTAEVVDVCPRSVVPLGETDGLRVRREQPCLKRGETMPHPITSHAFANKKQEGDKQAKRNERPNVRDASISSRSGAPSRKGCVVKWSNFRGTQQNEYAPIHPQRLFRRRSMTGAHHNSYMLKKVTFENASSSNPLKTAPTFLALKYLKIGWDQFCRSLTPSVQQPLF